MHSNHPNDIDIAIIQDTDQDYLSLSLKYRKLVRGIAKSIPLDIVPLKLGTTSLFGDELANGEIIYER